MIRLPFTTVVVGPPGEWRTRTNKDWSREEVGRHHELQAPVPWKTYVHAKTGLRATTNAVYLKRTWVRPLGSEGPGKDTKSVAINPWPAPRKGRVDLRVDLNTVPGGRNAYWYARLYTSGA